MRATLLTALLLAAPVAAQWQAEKSQPNYTADVVPAAPAVTGPPSVAVAVGETAAFRLATKAILLRARRVGPEAFTATQATDGNGVDVTVTGAAAGTGYLVFFFQNREVEVEVTVGDDRPSTKPQPVPAMARPTPPGPNPPDPPKPPPPDPPVPPPEPPGPVAPTKLVVVIVEETAAAVATRGAFLADRPLADFMAAHGHRWRVVDKDVTGADGKPPADVVRFLDRAKAAKLPTLFLVDPKGRTVHEGPVPATAAELAALLKKWGGE
jgi:hypothetical protein